MSKLLNNYKKFQNIISIFICFFLEFKLYLMTKNKFNSL